MVEAKMGAPVRPPDGDNIVAQFRRKWGLSQEQAAEKLGITRTAVSMYEQGERITVPFLFDRFSAGLRNFIESMALSNNSVHILPFDFGRDESGVTNAPPMGGMLNDEYIKYESTRCW